MKLTKAEKIRMFNDELSLINNKSVYKLCIYGLEHAPDYFFEIPASSSGKYHPQQDLGLYGLVKHTKSVINIGIDLVRAEIFVKESPEAIDFCIACGLFHDIVKNGWNYEKYTKHEHPILASQYLEKCANALNIKKDIPIGRYMKAISSHMGKWNTNRYSSIVLSKPESKYDMLLHTADYIASRKYIAMY